MQNKAKLIIDTPNMFIAGYISITEVQFEQPFNLSCGGEKCYQFNVVPSNPEKNEQIPSAEFIPEYSDSLPQFIASSESNGNIITAHFTNLSALQKHFKIENNALQWVLIQGQNIIKPPCNLSKETAFAYYELFFLRIDKSGT